MRRAAPSATPTMLRGCLDARVRLREVGSRGPSAVGRAPPRRDVGDPGADQVGVAGGELGPRVTRRRASGARRGRRRRRSGTCSGRCRPAESRANSGGFSSGGVCRSGSPQTPSSGCRTRAARRRVEVGLGEQAASLGEPGEVGLPGRSASPTRPPRRRRSRSRSAAGSASSRCLHDDHESRLAGAGRSERGDPAALAEPP